MLRAVQEHLAGASGVVSVAAADGLPLDQQVRRARAAREGEPASVRAHTTRVSAGYFETMGIRLQRGRAITVDDRPGHEPVVVISESLASQLFPSADPLGARLTLAMQGGPTPVDIRWSQVSAPSPQQVFTVIGVAEDVVDGYMGPAGPQLFVALAQHPVLHVVLIARALERARRLLLRSNAPSPASMSSPGSCVPVSSPVKTWCGGEGES